jgi:hypothetical protein
MKRFRQTFVLNIIALAVGVLNFADKGTTSGGMQTGSGATAGGEDQHGYVGAPFPRAKSLFDSIEEWTPGQFRNGVELNEVKNVRDPQGNSLLHRAIEVGNLEVAELIVKDYGLGADTKNREGVTCGALAIQKGPEFAGIFGDMKETSQA